MKILVACECSGKVRDAFIACGHDAVSCDLLPSDRPGPHVQGDVTPLLAEYWDMVIAFPPCTYLCPSWLHWNTRRPERAKLTEEAIAFARLFFDCSAPLIAIENPIGRLSSAIRSPDQIIQPWQFGHPESKSTCLWLKGLPRLHPTKILEKPACGHWDNQTPSGQNKLGPSEERAKKRSETYQGIADAMAAQWSVCECLT